MSSSRGSHKRKRRVHPIVGQVYAVAAVLTFVMFIMSAPSLIEVKWPSWTQLVQYALFLVATFVVSAFLVALFEAARDTAYERRAVRKGGR
jgi:protein-S-isoprenylcysteine O-methyltransferase Ste14